MPLTFMTAAKEGPMTTRTAICRRYSMLYLTNRSAFEAELRSLTAAGVGDERVVVMRQIQDGVLSPLVYAL